ncbi:hypothetical protein HDR63_01450 [bacterium]|nr:hypothetical protein [bacterium]
MCIDFKKVLLALGITTAALLMSDVAMGQLKTASQLKRGDNRDARAMQRDDNLMNSLQLTGMADRSKIDTTGFGHNPAEFEWVCWRFRGISLGSELTEGNCERIVNYLIQDTVTYKMLIEESIVANEFIWRERLKTGDRVQVLSFKDMLPGTVRWDPNHYGQNAFEVLITDANRNEIAHELADDLRYTGIGPVKDAWYPSEIVQRKLNKDCKMKGEYMFKIFAMAARRLQIKLHALDLLAKQRGVMENGYDSPENFER